MGANPLCIKLNREKAEGVKRYHNEWAIVVSRNFLSEIRKKTIKRGGCGVFGFFVLVGGHWGVFFLWVPPNLEGDMVVKDYFGINFSGGK